MLFSWLSGAASTASAISRVYRIRILPVIALARFIHKPLVCPKFQGQTSSRADR
jgi:hypothetical protein